jgi:vacuolar-type H+-ATPase catalytic subunit A/Vma1
LSGIREKLTTPAVKERFESGLSDQIYAKAEYKCPSIQLKRLMNSNSSFVLRQETTIEEATYFAELLQSLNVLLNQ